MNGILKWVSGFKSKNEGNEEMKITEYIRNPWLLIRFADNHHLLDSMQDEAYLKLVYRQRMGRKLDLDHPNTFNEKLQWLKLYDRKPEYTAMVDKYEAKKYVAGIIGVEHIIPTFGVWDDFDSIDFDSLPNQFVLKCTHDSGGLSICRDKKNFDKEKAREKIKKSLNTNYYLCGREWPYKDVKRRVIAEAYVEDGKNTSMTDYKFYCFHGEPKFLYISEGMENHHTAMVDFLDLDWNRMPFGRPDYRSYDCIPMPPEHLEEMLEIAKKLSKDIPFLRVDLYEINGCVFFSELTFFPCGGYMRFVPEVYDEVVGRMLKLPGEK